MPKPELKDHQVPHLEALLAIAVLARCFIDLSGLGTGKTVVAIALAIILGLQIIVICPNTAKGTWIDHLKRYRVLSPVTGFDNVISYDGFRSLTGYQPKHGMLKRTENPLTFTPTRYLKRILQCGVLFVFDEAQKLKNQDTQIIKAVFALQETLFSMPETKSRILLLSGSLFDKHDCSSNIMTMLGLGTDVEKLLAMCKAKDEEKYLKFIADNTLTNSVDENLYKIFITFFKDQYCSSMLMPARECVVDIKLGLYTIDKASEVEFDIALGKLASAFVDEQMVGGRKLRDFRVLGKALHMVQYAKRKLAIEKIQKQLDNGCKVLFFADYLDVMEEIMEHFKKYNPLIIHGQCTPMERELAKQRFNRLDNNYRLILITTSTGGASISLDDIIGDFPRVTYIMPGLKAIDIFQAIGRTNRVTTKGIVRTRLLFAKTKNDETEFRIMKALLSKGEILSSIHEGIDFFDKYEKEED